MKLTVIGCGDAFGAGGRLHSCFHVRSEAGVFLIDCGATSLIGLRRLGLDPNEIDSVFITHLHGDHFGGLTWMLLDGAHVSKRERPLLVTGPAGIEERFTAATEALFPRATQVPPRFEMVFREYAEGEAIEANGVSVTPFEVSHFSGAPPYALRISAAGRTITTTGDTEWVDALIPAAQGSDLLIAECYQYDLQLKYHLDYQTLSRNFARLGARRILLTHMSEAMLARAAEVDAGLCVMARDGLVLDV
ncbi:MAG: MBL fold metallo-hydrolase [Alphaproteobacteria bacterium]|nr:MAG: MBL fold metallo-hydrolase [Alphaproteobacteria bacterium]